MGHGTYLRIIVYIASFLMQRLEEFICQVGLGSTGLMSTRYFHQTKFLNVDWLNHGSTNYWSNSWQVGTAKLVLYPLLALRNRRMVGGQRI